MFKPFDFWKMEALHSGKINKAILNSPDKIKIKYETQNEETLMRYLKLAEHSYDMAKNIKKKFHTFLSRDELALLMKSYGCPIRYKNEKEYYIAKKQLNVKNADSLWRKVPENEQNEYKDEYEKYLTEYMLKMFHFSRDLPDSRIDDFLAFVDAEGEKKLTATLTPSNLIGDPKQIKLFRYQYAPYEIYYECNKEKFNDETSLHLNKVKARKHYSQLEDQEKLVYLKKCEKAFDHYEFRSVDNQKPMLSAVLSNAEMKILFNSYGLPRKIGTNLTSYYYILHCKKYKEDKMKNVMLDWAKLDETAKEEFQVLYAKDVSTYIERKKKFEHDLPKQRLIDLEYFERKEHEVTIPENKPKAEKKEKKKSSKSPKVESSEPVSSPTHGECTKLEDVAEKIDFDELDKRVLFAKLVEKLSNEEYYFENAFSYFVNEKLKSRQKMDQADSAFFLKKSTKEWLKLEEAEKEDYESKSKKSKKDFKKSYKKIVENHSDITLEIEEVKNLIKSHARQINVKLDEQTVEELVLSDKAVASLIDPAIKEFEVKSKKPKEVEENDQKSDKKRKSSHSVSGEKVKKSKSINNEGLGFE